MISLNSNYIRRNDEERRAIEEATRRYEETKAVAPVPPTARNRKAHAILVLPGSIDHQGGKLCKTRCDK